MASERMLRERCTSTTQLIVKVEDQQLQTYESGLSGSRAAIRTLERPIMGGVLPSRISIVLV